MLVGTSVVTGPLRADRAYRALIGREFDSVTPENQAKWAAVEPEPGAPAYGDLDALVDFALANHLAVRGHTLVWDPPSGNALPAWVQAIRDPVALRAALVAHIDAEVGRYAGRIDRWDVVNEPLEPLGTALAPNRFLTVLGAQYIDIAFATARRADPKATLWLNENAFEHLPAKADALVELVAGLVHVGVPIDGVGLQAHFVSGHAPAPGVIETLVTRLRKLGVAVAITELDIPMTAAGAAAQADAYRQVVTECLRAGCDEITVWGANDAVTWLDAFLGRKDTNPLLFDAANRPKAAYDAFRSALLTSTTRR